jgi:phosphotransferase system HPr (HPr) family protein
MFKKEIIFPFYLMNRRAVALAQRIQEATKRPFFIEKNERRVNAKSLLGLLSLGVKENDKVLLISDYEDELVKMEEVIKNLQEELL